MTAHLPPDLLRRIVNPARPVGLVEVLAAIVPVGPQTCSRMIPAGPRRRRRQRWHALNWGCGVDQLGQEPSQGSAPAGGWKKITVRDQRLGRNCMAADPRGLSDRRRTREARFGQRRLDRYAAIEPFLERPGLHHLPPPTGQLHRDYLRQMLPP